MKFMFVYTLGKQAVNTEFIEQIILEYMILK